MEISIISLGNPFDSKTWSKAPYSIIESLKKQNVVVSGINLTCFYNKLESWYFKIQRHFFFSGLCRSFFLYKKTCNRFSKVIEQSSSDYFLFMSEHCLDRKYQNKKFYLYVDSAMRPYYKYMPMNLFQRICYLCTLGIYEKNDRKSYSYLTKVFTQNDWTRNYLIHNYHLSPNKVINVGVGVNLVPLMEEKSYDNNLLLIVLRNHKTIEKIKGLPLLLAAFRILHKEMPNVSLAIVGTKGKEEPGVTYYFNQPRCKTEELFKLSTLYVMPALCEPNGITYLEALANKTPIVGLNRFAFPEFSGYGKYGFICPCDDPKTLSCVLKNALLDKNKLKVMGEECQKYVINRFSWENVVNRIANEILN